MRIDAMSALVAGGASGLGEATVRKLHAAGASVTIADLNSERGSALAGELSDRAGFCETDVTDGDSVRAAVDVATADPGGLRIAVCCAGIGWAERVAGRNGPHAQATFERVIAVNLIGTFNVLRLAATAMMAGDALPSGERGVIVDVIRLDGALRMPPR